MHLTRITRIAHDTRSSNRDKPLTYALEITYYQLCHRRKYFLFVIRIGLRFVSVRICKKLQVSNFCIVKKKRKEIISTAIQIDGTYSQLGKHARARAHTLNIRV